MSGLKSDQEDLILDTVGEHDIIFKRNGVEVSRASKIPEGKKNLLENATFNIWQEGDSIPSPASFQYLADRYFYQTSEAVPVQNFGKALSTIDYPNAGTVNFLNVNVIGLVTPVEDASERYHVFNQPIEFGHEKLSGKEVTAVFELATDNASFGFYIYSTVNGAYGAKRFVVATDGVDTGIGTKRYEHTFTLPTFGGVTERLLFVLCLADNTSHANAVGFSERVLSTGTHLNIIELGLVYGKIASKTDRRDMQEDLSLCQRHFYSYYNHLGSLAPYDAEASGGRGSSSTGSLVFRCGAPHPVLMRTVPEVTVNNVSVWDGVAQVDVISVSNNNSSEAVRSVDYDTATAMGGAGLMATEFVLPNGWIKVDAREG